jgi:hypothetical protein
MNRPTILSISDRIASRHIDNLHIGYTANWEIYRLHIPSCVVKAIRDAFPEDNGQYEGFNDATYV